MPTVGTSREGSTRQPKGGRVGTTRAEAGSGRVGTAPRGAVLRVGASGRNVAATQSTKAQIDAAGRKHVGPGPAFTPVRTVLDAASTVNYAIGDAIAHPSHLNPLHRRGLIDVYRDPKKTSIGDALEKRGALDSVPKGATRTLVKLGLDIGLDPTTYVTFGSGTALKAAGRAAALKASERVIEKGARLSLAERAAHSAEAAAERAAAPRVLSVGVRVPFTRGKTLVLAESEAPARLAASIGRRIPDSLTAGFRSGGEAAPVVNEVFQDVRRLAAVERGELRRATHTLNTDIRHTEKALGLKPGQGAAAITRHLDNPAEHALPVGLEDLAARSRAMLDKFHAAEQEAGIEKGVLANYVPHLLATPKDRRAFESVYGQPTPSSIDDPFFVKARELDNLDAFEEAGHRHGFRPELNIAKLIERRGQASLSAQTKKALDDAIMGTHGVKPPPLAVPSTAKAEARVGRRQDELAQAIESGDRELVATTQGRLDTAQRKLTKTEKRAGAIRLANESLVARVGMPSSPETWKALREEWVQVGTATKYHDGNLLPPGVARALDRVHRSITPTIRDEDAVAATSRFVRNATTRWKALALLSPGYHLRNMQSDALAVYWAGARNPATFVRANRLLRGKGGIKIGERTYTAKEIRDLAESEGVIGTGFVRSEIESSADDIGRRRLAGPGRGPLARGSQKVGDIREETMRLGLFLELLKKGEHAGQAARTTREYLFDYGEVGQFVEAARRFWLPFVTFTSKAIPLTLKTFATQPGRAASLDKLINASQELAGNPDMSYLPPWSASSFAIPSTPAMRSLIGAPRDQDLVLDPTNVAGFATIDQLDPRPDALRRSIISRMVTPFARVPVEAVTNYSSFRGREFNPGERVYAPQLVQLANRLGVPIPGYGPKRDRYSGETGVGYSPRLDTLLRLLPIYGQASQVLPSRSESTQLGAVKYVAGLPISPYDRLRSAYFAERLGKR